MTRRGPAVTLSRPRRARRIDALGLTLAATLVVLLGFIALTLAGRAKADPDDQIAYDYTAAYGTAVCSTLDDHASFDGIIGIGEAIHGDGLSYRQAGQVISIAVMRLCPRHTGLLEAFIGTFHAKEKVSA